jgi:glycosyltransferase involved in cell wall biosynthesis
MVALYLNYIKSVPYIITEHYTGYLNFRSKQLSKTEIFFTKNIIKKAKTVCPVSTNLKDNMINLGFQGKYKVIPNIVDTEIFKPETKINKRFTISHISSLVDDHKNISGILRTVSKLQEYIPDILFYLIGENPFQYTNEIKALNIKSENIILIGQIPYHEVASYLQDSDILIMFSNYENLPCIILEAFACGTPVISTDVGGISELFPDSFGKLISRGDEDELLNTILSFYRSNIQPDKNKMHIYGKVHFSREVILSEYSGLYHNILKDLSR